MTDNSIVKLIVIFGICVGIILGVAIAVIIGNCESDKPKTTDIYINGIHYKEINGTTVNITKDSLEMQIYKDYQKRFIK